MATSLFTKIIFYIPVWNEKRLKINDKVYERRYSMTFTFQYC